MASAATKNPQATHQRGGPGAGIVIGGIAVYRLVSAGLSPRCRFEPSCSEYTQLAIRNHGVCAGLKLAVVRICKCHPFHEGGIDPVPRAAPGIKGLQTTAAGLGRRSR